ncbi:MAG: YdcF family protein [Aureliella sp.]
MTNESGSSARKPRAGGQPPGLLRSFLLFAFIAGVIATALAALGGMLNGRAGVEKTISELCYPVGFVWWVASASSIFHLFQRRPRIGLGLASAAVAIWICGTEFVPNIIAGSLERSVAGKFDPATEPPLDTLVVLGGGTSLHATRAQAATSGDRVVLAAQLFHGGHARRLITTGRVEGGTGLQTADLGQQTIEIWTRLGIPREKIDTLPGMNTYQEIQAVKGLPDSVHAGRLGVLTSALHLPRAMRLAKAAGIDPVPVAADYRVTETPRISLVPSAGNLQKFSAAQHEYMAYFVGR